jgi:hypothetical protein
MANGERILGGAFGLLGLLWAVMALDLTYMRDFAPGSGFLPLWLGVALVLLSGAFLYTTRKTPAPSNSEDTPLPFAAWGKTASILLGLFVCVGVLDLVGFLVSVTAYLIFLVKVVEGRGCVQSLGVSLGTTVSLFLIFKTWFGVPFPVGPWGF